MACWFLINDYHSFLKNFKLLFYFQNLCIFSATNSIIIQLSKEKLIKWVSYWKKITLMVIGYMKNPRLWLSKNSLQKYYLLMPLTQHCRVMCTSVTRKRLVCGVSLYMRRRARASGARRSPWCSGLPLPVSGRCQKSPEFYYALGFLLPGGDGLRKLN